MTFLFVFLLFLAIILLGMPLMTAMGLPAVLACFFVPKMSAVPLGPRMVSSVSTFTMLAVPFFMMAGEIMCQGNLTERLVRFCNSLIGHIRGGLAYVAVLVNMILAGMSGAAAADVATKRGIPAPSAERCLAQPVPWGRSSRPAVHSSYTAHWQVSPSPSCSWPA